MRRAFVFHPMLEMSVMEIYEKYCMQLIGLTKIISELAQAGRKYHVLFLDRIVGCGISIFSGGP